METLELKISNTPKSLFKDKEHYLRFRSAWKQAVNNPETKHLLTAEYHTLYAMLRGKDWTKCFTSITNKNKLDNGRTPEDTLISTLRNINGWIKRGKDLTIPFSDTITPEILSNLSLFIPSAKWYSENHKPYLNPVEEA